MKKICYLIVAISTLFFTMSVKASSFNVSIIGNTTFENEITLYVQINNLVDFSDTCKGLCGLVGNLNYDVNKIELTSINALEGFDLTQGDSIVLFKSTGVPSGTKILVMKFKNKSLKENETTTISLSNLVGTDGDSDITTNNCYKTIKLIKKQPENNDQNNKPSNKPDLNNNTNGNKSSNNYLSSITLSDGNITFNKDILNYDIVVDYETTSIEVKGIAEDEKSVINGLGNYDLNVGNNVIKLTVKAEDNTEKIYTLNIYREEKEIKTDDDKKNDANKEDIKNENVKNGNTKILVIIIASISIVGLIIFYIFSKNKKSK